MGTSTLVTGPTVWPVSANELGAHLRLNQADGAYPEADYLLNLVKGATEFAEAETGLAMLEQTWAHYLDEVPIRSDGLGWWDGVREGAMNQEHPRFIELPKSPLISITSIKSFDEADVESTFGTANYYVDVASRPGRVALRDGSVWPTNVRSVNGLVITYKAGFGTTADKVPFQLRQAIKVIAAHWYENREAMTMDMSAANVPGSAWDILGKYKVRRL